MSHSKTNKLVAVGCNGDMLCFLNTDRHAAVIHTCKVFGIDPVTAQEKLEILEFEFDIAFGASDVWPLSVTEGS